MGNIVVMPSYCGLQELDVQGASDGVPWAIRSWHEFARGGQVPTRAVAAVPGPGDRAQAWRDGLRAAASVLPTSLSPPLDRLAVQRLLREVTNACGRPAISGW